MKLVLMGIQGAGKSTQGNLLSKQLKVPYMSTGHIFREIAKEKTQLGRYIKELTSVGSLIPDEKTIEVVNSYISRPEYKNGYILDGFPRTLKQAETFSNNVDKIIVLELSDREALWRLLYRRETRNDDSLEAIKKRIELYHTHTEHVVKYYESKGKLIRIDATQSIEDVNEEILKSLGKQMVRNQLETWKKKHHAIIACVGLPGAGKTEASDYFAKKGLPIISFGKVINDYIDEHYHQHSEAIHKKVREEIRVKHGIEALAKLNENKIANALEENMVVVIDGMRSWEEYVYLKGKFPKVKINIVAIFADKALRYNRISKRKYRKELFGEQRDIDELIGTNMGPTIAFADYLIKNNFSKEEFYDKLEAVYREIYFS